jgi:ferredoxin
VTRVEVDRERCVGSGTCEMIAPDVFEVDDDGIVVVRRPAPEGEDAEAAEEAVRACPTQALELTDQTQEGPEQR